MTCKHRNVGGPVLSETEVHGMKWGRDGWRKTWKSLCANVGSIELVLLTTRSTVGFPLENNVIRFLSFPDLQVEKYNLWSEDY